jgi:PHP family Zn ribbon phosphoesterase
MNWRIKELDHRSILSFSDAHSGPKIGREATVFEIPDGKLSYEAIYQAIRGNQANNESGIMNHGKEKAKNHNSKFIIHDSSIAYTIEFYPEEGKYHWSGHRACNIRWGPKETEKNGNTCPVCGKNLTQGVEQRVGELAGRSEEALQLTNLQNDKLTKARMIGSKAFPKRPPFVMLVPLQEILSECIGSPVASPKVQTPYRQLTDALGGEFNVLLASSQKEIEKAAGERAAVGIEKVRRGDIHIDPGYDGVFGVVKIWREGEQKPLVDASKEQLRIF